MAVQLEQLNWRDLRSISEIAASAKERRADYLLLSNSLDAISRDAVEDALRLQPTADMIVFVNPKHPARKQGRRELLPPFISLIAASPDEDRAVVISISALSKGDRIDRSRSLQEFVVRLAETAAVAFVEVSADHEKPDYSKPPLTAPATKPDATWLRDVIPGITVPNAKPVTLTALQAGLFLLTDFFDESHSCSQSIEGEGRYHTGDYWHAILHRREPDYGNSKYWFRHVGRHPIFADLKTAAGNIRTHSRRAEQFQGNVISSGSWDPFAFVDLCSAAEDDSELKEWCEAVQYEEMLLLLDYSYRETTGIDSRTH
jgi:hypothetical protein